MSTQWKRRNVLTAIIAFGLFFCLLLPALGEPTGPSIFRYDEKRTGNSNLVSNIVSPGPRWVFNTSASKILPPIAGDINDDGNMELVFGTYDGILYALDENGEVLWTFQAEGKLGSPPAMGDVDGDGNVEIVIGGAYFRNAGDANLYVVNGEDGSLVWIFHTMDEDPNYYISGYETAPTLYDINDDGKLDVLIGSRNYFFYALDGADGSVMWKSQFEHFIRSSSPMGDIDQDGNVEILVVDNHALGRLFEVDGSVDWEMYLGGYGSAATSIFADVNGDGYDEIIFFSIGSPGMPSVYRYDGSLLWSNSEYTYFYSTPTLYDVDEDGLLDILNVDTNDQVLIAYKGTDGSILYTAEPFEKNFMAPGLSTGDIDGDGETEVLVGASPNLFCINAADGSVDWIYDTDGEGIGGGLLVDLDGDGLVEIIIRVKENLICLENKDISLDLLDKIIEYILGLPDECFKNNADQRKNALVNKLESVRNMIIDGNYEAAIDKLKNDIRPKMDGEGNNDWIICEQAHDDLTQMIDELIDYLESQL